MTKQLYYYEKDPSNQYSHPEVSFYQTRSVYGGYDPVTLRYNNTIEQGIAFHNQLSDYNLEFQYTSHRYVAAGFKIVDSIYPYLLDMPVLLDGKVFDEMLKAGQVTTHNGCLLLEGKFIFKKKGVLKLCEP